MLSLHPKEFELVAISAHKNRDLWQKQVIKYRPKFAALTGFESIENLPKTDSRLFYGKDALDELLSIADFDEVVVALVGMVGLQYVLRCLQMGKRVLLANKEALVAGGKLVLEEVRKASELAKNTPSFVPDACFCSGETLPSPLSRILPIDSEHSAIFQCMNSINSPIDKIFLTCSGGPFRLWKTEAIAKATKQDALKHPKWNMGAKITIDSATLFNKALEIIEAKYLFGVDESRIEVLIHPQSIVHSMVGFVDKGIIAQLGIPSMKLPILYSMSYPKRLNAGINYPDLTALEFAKPDVKKFPSLRLVREALQRDDASCAVLNASNEVAVDYFLQERIAFGDIFAAVEHCLTNIESLPVNSFKEILYADSTARRITKEFLEKR